MREIIRKNGVVYSYTKYERSEGIIYAIILYAIAVLFLFISIVISLLYLGEAPSIVGGLGLTSIIFNTGSLLNVILDIYFYRNFHTDVRTLLILQIILYSVWIFLV